MFCNFIFLVDPDTPERENTIEHEESDAKSNESTPTPSPTALISISSNNNWDPQPPTLAPKTPNNTSIDLVDNSTNSQTSSISDQGNNSSPGDDGHKLVIDGPDVTAIENLIDDISNGINKVANQLSTGLSFDKDSKESLDSHSHKSVSSLESDMTAKLAQPSLVPPDVISNWYKKL